MEKEKIDYVKSKVRNIPDFPVKGIQFKDLTTAFKDPESLNIMRDAIIELYKDKGITKVVGIEARGFIFGAIVASALGAGFVPLRKPGKLPYEKVSIEYKKEYGFMKRFYCKTVTSFNARNLYCMALSAVLIFLNWCCFETDHNYAVACAALMTIPFMFNRVADHVLHLLHESLALLVTTLILAMVCYTIPYLNSVFYMWQNI